ncbi:MAG: SusC/RagA family TonB-linked outer membrane protein [Niastella sp.]|nr:SusC/RagA family TonB-linked outer membrane protein [Niastella sp.]
MLFKALCNSPVLYRLFTNQNMRIMKLMAVLLFTACMQVSAAGFSQTVSLQEKGASPERIFQQIKKQTGYTFWYKLELLEGARNVDVSLRNAPLVQALDIVTKDQPFTYEIIGKTVVIKKRTLHIMQEVVPPPPVFDIDGRIVDSRGVPLEGISIQVKGSQRGASTNKAGHFIIQGLEQPATITVSGIGYLGLRFRVSQTTEGKTVVALLSANRQAATDAATDTTAITAVSSVTMTASGILITLVQKDDDLGAVTINAGYYKTNRRTITGSISRVDARTIQMQPVSNPLQALQGRMPGVYISQVTGMPGSNFQVRIRGINSIRNGNDPLYVIDGVQFGSQTLSDVNASGAAYRQQGISPLNSINPDDIESIEVLKDADATAIYGSRGANGVVLITTKKGKAGSAKVDVNMQTGLSQVAHKVALLNTEQYLAMRHEALANDGEAQPPSWEYDVNGTWDTTRYTDWQDVLLGGSAVTTRLNASVSGGNQETQFYLSGGYEKQNTVFPGSNDAQRYSTHFSVNHTSANRKFNARLNTSYVINNTNIIAGDFSGIALQLPPTAPALYTPDGKLNWVTGFSNPVADLEVRFLAQTYNLVTNAELGYELVKGLRIKAFVGINDVRNEDRRKEPSSKFNPILNYTPAVSTLTIGQGNLRSWIAEPQVNWDIHIGKGKLSMLAGATFKKDNRMNEREIFTGFASNELLDNPRAASNIRIDSYNVIEYRYSAVYGRLNYNWDEKYIVNIIGRRDGSSRFGPGKSFANFGAAGIAWVFSREAFMQDWLPFLSFGKLRGSYGTAGNDEIGDYRYLNTYAPGYAYAGMSTLMPSRLFNPLYGWETNKKIEGAMELGFLNDRIQFTAGYFSNRSYNQLIDYPLGATSGFTSINANSAATVRNTGVELELTSFNIRNGSLEWRTNLNLTFLRNKLVAFPGLESSSYANTYEIGQPLNIQKRYHFLGLDPQTGIYRFEDMNKDGQVTNADTRQPVSYMQDFFGGIGNSLSYKGLEVNVFFQFVKQNNAAYTTWATPGRADYNQPASVMQNRWRKPGDQTSGQLFTRYNAAATEAWERYRFSDALVTDASFIRLKNVDISYRLPERWLGGVRSRIYLQGQNLATITNYVGMDPETGYGGLPPLRTFMAGIQLTF